MRRSLFFVLLTLAGTAPAAVRFSSREIFRVPFGDDRGQLGARVDNGQFLYPREFTMDRLGHFYINDANKHRIARFSLQGKYEIGYAYPATAKQVFAHADAHENLWLLISDPSRGVYIGIHDAQGKRLREAVFSQFDQYRMHLDDEYVLHIILSSTKNPGVTQTYFFDEQTMLMKKENIASPPENHHRVRKSDRVYFIDAVPGAHGEKVNRITDESRRGVANIQGSVIYVTNEGDIYTRVGNCRINVYNLEGILQGKVALSGLPSACGAVRFEPDGTMYQLDGIPDADNQYTPQMTGMRLLRWERH